jgi:hypothetical protein
MSSMTFNHLRLHGCIALALALAAGVAMPAHARRAHDQEAVFDQRRAGAIRPLHEIEGHVMPHMGGAAYLGPEFDARSATYRLKFMRSGSVIWVDVDGRTGAIIGRSGN